jgi:tRNA G18 (ribose-2'-O)-methylase SpoU
MSVENIRAELDKSRMPLEIAIENWSLDFNVGSIIRTANAFNVAKVHIIGKRRYNARGAMCTEKYMHVVTHENVDDFAKYAVQAGLTVIGIDVLPTSSPIEKFEFPKKCALVFGSESDGLTNEAIRLSEQVLHITQEGSTRSINAHAAAAIAMYAYRTQQAID